MTMMDYVLDTADHEASVEIDNTSWGYRIREVEMKGWRVHVARAVTAALCFGMMAAGGMVWTLTDATFPGDPAITKAVLSTAIYIVAAALVANGAFLPKRDSIEIDTKGRTLNIVSRSFAGWRKNRKTYRFEEITRIDLAETSLMNELRSAITRWDYGSITLSIHGTRDLRLLGGDMDDLGPLLSRLRGDAGVV